MKPTEKRRGVPDHPVAVSWDDGWAFGTGSDDAKIGLFTEFLFPALVHLHGRVRVDPFTIVTCGLEAHDGVHISNHVFLNGGGGQKVVLHRWSFVGSGSRLITASDDFTGVYGPIGPFGKNLMQRGDIIFWPFSGVAIGCSVLPGTELPEGVCIAAHGLVDPVYAEQFEEWCVYACPPGREPRLLYRRDKETCIRLADDPEFQNA